MGYSIKQMSLTDHKKDIIEIWKGNLSEFHDDRYEWFYFRNPSGQAKSWLAINDQGEVITGSAALYPRDIKVDNRNCKIGIAADFAIQKAHRVFGPAIQLQKAIINSYSETGYSFILAYPSLSSRAVFERVGYRILGTASGWSRVLKSKNKVQGFFRIRLISFIASLFYDSFMKLSDEFFLFFYKGKFRTKILDRCDEKFDDLWLRAKDKYPILGERSSKYLNWRYVDNQSNPHKFYVALNEVETRVHAYINYVIKNNTAYISDILAEEDSNSEKFILLKFSKEMRKAGIESIYITYLGNMKFTRLLKKLYFFERKQSRVCFIHLPNENENTMKTLLDLNNWYLMDGEMDL
jgi:hypothetical protein